MPGSERQGSRAASLQGVRVLVAEDDWHVAHAFKTSIEQMGMIVAGPVATSEEAQRLAKAEKPELAVVDVNLKGEMAYPLMGWLNERGIGVVITTGYQSVPAPMGKLGATLRKPFTAAALQRSLEQALQRHRRS